MAEWFETFFDGLYGRVLRNQFDEARSREHARIVRRLLKVRKGDKVLDIPCGMGRLTIPLAKTGLAMTGVDRTASYLRRARRDAREEGVRVRFVHRDMREIAFDGEFAGAFNWFGSFGYFSDADNLRFCERVFAGLRPGGRFLVEGMNKSWLVAHFRSEAEVRRIGGVAVEIRCEWDARTSRVLGRWTFRKGGVTERHGVRIKAYNGAEMRALLRGAGFREIALYGYPPIGRLLRHSRRIMAVGRRPRRELRRRRRGCA